MKRKIHKRKDVEVNELPYNFLDGIPKKFAKKVAYLNLYLKKELIKEKKNA